MGKLVVWKYIKATDFINRYQDDDDLVGYLEVVENLPEAKAEAIKYLEDIIQEVKDIKLKDIT